MEEIESVHGEADSTPIKDIKVRFVPYDATIPTVRKFDGSVNRPEQAFPVSGVLVSWQGKDKISLPDIYKDGDESDARQHERRLAINRSEFCLDCDVGGLSEEPSAGDGLVKDEADKQFCSTGDELWSPVH